MTGQDFAQVSQRIRIEVRDLILSREKARLGLIFRQEDAGWMIVHSGIFIPYIGA